MIPCGINTTNSSKLTSIFTELTINSIEANTIALEIRLVPNTNKFTGRQLASELSNCISL